MDRFIEIDGRNFYFEGPDDRYLANLTEENESSLAEFAKNHIPNDATIIDIGANIGFVSTLFAAYNTAARIYAIEPGKMNFKYLKNNVSKNNLMNVFPRNFACSDSNYLTDFFENSAWGYLDINQITSDGSLSNITEVKTVDSFVSEERLERIDLIKIDVEGFERQVLSGMNHTLSSHSPKIILEFNTYCLICQGRQDPFSFLEEINAKFSHKYRFARPGEDKELLIQLPNKDFEKNFIHTNIIEHGSVDDLLLFN
jgi:FkbM family methyltransferase